MKTSGHCWGQRGRGSFAYQNHGGLRRGRINARKFARFVQPTDIILDFGCGSGALLIHLACGRRLGVEVNPAAREDAAKAGLEVHARLEAVADRSVTVALSNHVLEHVPCPVQIPVDLRRKLVRDGPKSVEHREMVAATRRAIRPWAARLGGEIIEREHNLGLAFGAFLEYRAWTGCMSSS